jgi:hypothetical protein
MNGRNAESGEPGRWLWVTGRDYYLDEDGEDSVDLDPSFAEDNGGWWTCHKTTRKGDLVLLWRTMPRSDIGYLIQARSDAYSIADDPFAKPKGWDYGCDYAPLYKFSMPLTVKDVRADPYLADWSALRGRFQGRVFAIRPEIWEHLSRRLKALNKGYEKVLAKFDRALGSTEIVLEEELENHLVTNLDLLKPFGYNLELVGRQVICTGHGGRIDLLCKKRGSKRDYVVIELKNVQAGQNTLGQVMTYMGWVKDRIADATEPEGLVIARGFDTRYLSAASLVSKTVRHLSLEQLGFR